MHAIAAMIILALPPHQPYRQREHVDLVELNHLIDERNEVRFSQVILWRWTPTIGGSRYVVAEWMTVDCESTMLDRFGDDHRLTWRDKHGRVYEAVSGTFRETWTRDDPEIEDRHTFPVECRRAYFLR